VGALRADDSRAFLEAEVKPAAQLDRGRDVLLLRGYRPAAAASAGAPGAAAAVPVPPPAAQPVEPAR